MADLKDRAREELAQTEEFARGAKESAKRRSTWFWATAAVVGAGFLCLIVFGA